MIKRLLDKSDDSYRKLVKLLTKITYEADITKRWKLRKTIFDEFRDCQFISTTDLQFFLKEYEKLQAQGL